MIINNHDNSEKNAADSQPQNINNQDVDFKPSAHDIKGETKTPLKQSELGRDQGQSPASEEQEFTNIDKGTLEIQKQKMEAKEDTPERKDGRDPELDSSKDWDAEKNRTGRHK